MTSKSTETCDSYALVLKLWAETAYSKLCADVANAATPAIKALALEQLKTDAPKYVAIIQGAHLITRAGSMETEVGQISVARDLFQSILESGVCSDVMQDAIIEWIVDVDEHRSSYSTKGSNYERASSSGDCGSCESLGRTGTRNACLDGRPSTDGSDADHADDRA